MYFTGSRHWPIDDRSGIAISSGRFTRYSNVFTSRLPWCVLCCGIPNFLRGHRGSKIIGAKGNRKRFWTLLPLAESLFRFISFLIPEQRALQESVCREEGNQSINSNGSINFIIQELRFRGIPIGRFACSPYRFGSFTTWWSLDAMAISPFPSLFPGFWNRKVCVPLSIPPESLGAYVFPRNIMQEFVEGDDTAFTIGNAAVIIIVWIIARACIYAKQWYLSATIPAYLRVSLLETWLNILYSSRLKQRVRCFVRVSCS